MTRATACCSLQVHSGGPVADKKYQNQEKFRVGDISTKPLDSALFDAYKPCKKQNLLASLLTGQFSPARPGRLKHIKINEIDSNIAELHEYGAFTSPLG